MGLHHKFRRTGKSTWARVRAAVTHSVYRFVCHMHCCTCQSRPRCRARVFTEPLLIGIGHHARRVCWPGVARHQARQLFLVMTPTHLKKVGVMTGIALFVLVAGVLSACSGWRSPSTDALPIERRLSQVRIGMADKEAVALMRPASLDWGRVYWGGSGASRLYFQISSTQQVWFEVSGPPAPAITAIGTLEPKTKWTRYTGDSITVE